jgi:hypothetical protein
MPDKFGAAMALVKTDIGGNVSVRCPYYVFSTVRFTSLSLK